MFNSQNNLLKMEFLGDKFLHSCLTRPLMPCVINGDIVLSERINRDQIVYRG